VIESLDHVPFEIKRIYYLYGIPDGAIRGEHGHRNLQQLIIPVAGEFRVTLDDGHASKCYDMSRPDEGLYVAPMMWRSIDQLSPNAVCLVVVSEKYDESDYIRTYAQFKRAVQAL